jgi:hypothetical protein
MQQSNNLMPGNSMNLFIIGFNRDHRSGNGSEAGAIDGALEGNVP